MPESDTYISVEADEVDWKELLQVVRDKQQSIHILSKGQRIAELTPPSDKRRLEPVDSRLKVEFSPNYDPTAGVSEEDWPSRLR